jgi:hypothetical protein
MVHFVGMHIGILIGICGLKVERRSVGRRADNSANRTSALLL